MLQGPSIRVAISRPTTIDDFHLPSPLFKDYQSGCPDTLTRSEVRKKWIKALMPSNTLLAELNRFDQLAEQTISNHRVLYKQISDRLSLHPPSARLPSAPTSLPSTPLPLQRTTPPSRLDTAISIPSDREAPAPCIFLIPKHGSCLFTAASQGDCLARWCEQGLEPSEWTPLPLSASADDDLLGRNLRHQSVAELRKKWEHDKDTVDAILVEIRSDTTGDRESSALDQVTNKEEYLQAMMSTRVWGGEQISNLLACHDSHPSHR